MKNSRPVERAAAQGIDQKFDQQRPEQIERGSEQREGEDRRDSAAIGAKPADVLTKELPALSGRDLTVFSRGASRAAVQPEFAVALSGTGGGLHGIQMRLISSDRRRIRISPAPATSKRREGNLRFANCDWVRSQIEIRKFFARPHKLVIVNLKRINRMGDLSAAAARGSFSSFF